MPCRSLEAGAGLACNVTLYSPRRVALGAGKTVEIMALILMRPPPQLPSVAPSGAPDASVVEAAATGVQAGTAEGKRSLDDVAVADAPAAKRRRRTSAGKHGAEHDATARSRAPAVAAGVVAGFPSAGKAAGGTLIVCPPTLLQQWANELDKHASSLRVVQYEGT